MDTGISPEVSLDEYPECSNGIRVVLLRMNNGGHTWPGTPSAEVLESMGFGEVNREIAATEMMWSFFENHSRR